jgi:fructan beta-fructosidase
MRKLLTTFLFLLMLGCMQILFAQSTFLPTNYDEPYRGQYHFSQQSGWMNDVNGLWYNNGIYYMTYQTTPNSLSFDFTQCSLGMATSPDMMHWTQKPVIAEPTATEGTPMSGSVVIDSINTSGLKTGINPVFVAIYTSENTGQCLLYSNDLGNTWQRYQGNPVINTGGTNPRDPHVFWYAPTNKWVMVLYHENNGGNTDIYNSSNLINWTLTSSVTGFGHECPDFIQLPVDGNQNTQKWVLWAGDSGYLTGDFNGSTFTQDPGGWKLLDNNNSTFFYAAQTFNVASLPGNRYVQIGWQGNPGLMSSSTLVPEYAANTRWNQNATFPTQLSLTSNAGVLKLCANPIPEISTIWGSTQNWDKQTLSSTGNLLSSIQSKCFDVTAEFDLTATTATQLKFLIANKTITYDITAHTLNGKILNPVNNILKIRILGDWSQYELFGNDGLFYWSERFAFDPANSSLGLTTNGNVILNSMTFHTIKRTWSGTATPGYTKYEAESGTVGGGATKSVYASASGGYQVGMMDNVGAYFQISVNALRAGMKTISIVYAAGLTDTRYKSLYVNGIKIRQLTFIPTGGWSDYNILNTDVTLDAGLNTLRIQRDAADNTATDFDCVLVPVESGIASKNLILPGNSDIQYMGRIDFSNPDKPLFAYPNVTIKAKFEGTSLDMLLNHFNGSDFADNYFISSIDGATPVKFKVTSLQQKYPVASDLTSGTHTVEIVKVTETYNGECQFLGFQTDSAKTLLTPDPLPALKLEFFGNSITSGYGIEGGAQPAADNSYKAYPAVAARILNAQLQTTSYSGIGVVKGYPAFLMSQMYNRIVANPAYSPIPANNTWNFNRYIPDYVVVALGTNDYNLGFGAGTITAATFNTGYNSLITKIRAAYPTAQIICTNSPMISDSKLGSTINGDVTTFNAAGDTKIHYFAFTHMQGGGFNGHPGVADGQTNGIELATYIRSLMNSTSVNEIDKSNADIILFPNPAKTRVSITNLTPGTLITVTGLDSKSFLTKKVEGSTASFNVSNWNKGIYLFNIQEKNSLTVRKVEVN